MGEMIKEGLKSLKYSVIKRMQYHICYGNELKNFFAAKVPVLSREWAKLVLVVKIDSKNFQVFPSRITRSADNS